MKNEEDEVPRLQRGSSGDGREAARRDGNIAQGAGAHEHPPARLTHTHCRRTPHPPSCGRLVPLALTHQHTHNVRALEHAQEAGRLARYNARKTVAAREVQTSVRLIFPGTLAQVRHPRPSLHSHERPSRLSPRCDVSSHLVLFDAQGAVAEGTRAVAAASAGKEESDDEALAEDDEPVEKADSVFNMRQLSTVIREACNSARVAAGPLTPSSDSCLLRACTCACSR
jgi:hypothetical protein